MKIVTSFFLSLFIMTVCLTGLSPGALAEVPVSVFLYRADPNAKNGYREVYEWRMNWTDEWRRFEYIVSKTPTAKKEDISPFMKKPPELIVLSVKNSNGITGRDYYISPYGIMLTSIAGKNLYYRDSHDFLGALQTEMKNRSSFESFPGEKIPTTSDGILVRYQINDNLPNPSWLIADQKNVNLYDSFMRDNPTPDPGDINEFIKEQPFEEKGNFILLLNYPDAPGKFATIGPAGIRLSTLYSSDMFYADPKNYWKFFYDLTQDSKNSVNQVKKKEQLIIERGQF